MCGLWNSLTRASIPPLRHQPQRRGPPALSSAPGQLGSAAKRRCSRDKRQTTGEVESRGAWRTASGGRGGGCPACVMAMQASATCLDRLSRSRGSHLALGKAWDYIKSCRVERQLVWVTKSAAAQNTCRSQSSLRRAQCAAGSPLWAHCGLRRSGFRARRAVRTGEGLKNSPFVATAAAALAAAATAAGVPPEEARRRQ